MDACTVIQKDTFRTSNMRRILEGPQLRKISSNQNRICIQRRVCIRVRNLAKINVYPKHFWWYKLTNSCIVLISVWCNVLFSPLGAKNCESFSLYVAQFSSSFPPIQFFMCQLTPGISWESSPAGYREPYLVSWREEGAPTWHQQEQELLPGDMPTLRIGSCLFHLYLPI